MKGFPLLFERRFLSRRKPSEISYLSLFISNSFEFSIERRAAGTIIIRFYNLFRLEEVGYMTPEFLNFLFHLLLHEV